ncbi:MAG: hypothetical protein KF901_16540, partial [Myxococcales bacterium]|nr:hypothetical protein [Myxococcales bacterium]
MASSLFSVVLWACGPEDVPPDGSLVDAALVDGALVDAVADGALADAAADAALADAAADVSPADAAADVGPMDAGGSLVTRFDEVLAALRGPSLDAATADAILTDVARTDRWPLTDGERWVFVTRQIGATEVSWVGDPNGWAPDADRAERLASGAHYLVVKRFDAAPRGAKYKWFVDASFLPPSEATCYGEDANGEHGWVAPPVGQPWLERSPGFAAPSLATRSVRVRVPAGAVWSVLGGTRPAPTTRTLLLHDGQNVFGSGGAFGSWRVDATLERVHRDLLAVAVDNASDRFFTYTHVEDELGGSGAVGGGADVYLELVEAEILPFVRARYGVAASGASLAIMGSSLGGLVSLYAALSRPRLAGCVMAMSSSLGWGAFARDGRDALVHRWTERGPVAIYLDSGGGGTCADLDGDGVFEDSDDRDNYCVTLQLRDRLASLGYVFGADLFHWHEPGAPHSEAAWALRVERALDACTAA